MAKNAEARRQAGKRGSHGGPANRGHKKGQGALKKGSAFTKSAASSKAGRTAPNGESRVRTKGSHYRSESTIKRLDMYTKKPNIQKMKEQATGPVRIQPDRRWFGNTRVIAQDKMQAFRETISKGVEDPFSVVLKSSKLPISLLKDTEGKNSRMDLLSIQPFKETFSKKRQQKRVKLNNYDLEGLLENVDKKTEGYDGRKDRQLQVDPETGKAVDGHAMSSVQKSHRAEEIFNKGTSKRIWGELYKVIDAADVIVFVLDARDPPGTRCLQLEKELRAQKAHKHIILCLNKVDLVPTWVSRRWVQVLMKDFPTLAFHASITNPFGKNALLNLLRQFSTLMKDKKHITVGMIGYPNVGKSSVINTLKRKKVCKAAPVPGETRVWQYIALTKRLYLLDCPGIVPPSASDFNSDCAKVLKGVVRAERIQTPSDYIDEVLTRVKKQYLCQKYKLDHDTQWSNGEEFLTIICQKMGRLLKGGDPDLDTGARIVLYDWQRGRIPFFTTPPDDAASSSDAPAATTVASSTSSAAQPSAESDKPKALEDAAAAADAASEGSDDEVGDNETSVKEAPDGGALVTVQQSFSDLGCVLEFDEEDRRGEALPSAAASAAGSSGDAPAAAGASSSGSGAAKGGGRGKAKAAAKGAAAKGKKRKRGGGGAGGGDDEGARGGGGGRRQGAGGRGDRAATQLRPGGVDWNAVVAEFGM